MAVIRAVSRAQARRRLHRKKLRLGKAALVVNIRRMTTTYPRSKQETDKELAILDKHHKERMKSKEEMLAFLVRAGLMTKSGRPTKRYRND